MKKIGFFTSSTSEIPNYIVKTLFLGGEIKGSLIDAMNTLAKRFEFKVKYVPARGFDNLVKNVRSMVPNVIC